MSRERDPGLRERWRKRLERFRRCELTVAEFCKREAVSTAAFYAWQRQLRSKAAAAVAPVFVPLRLAADGDRQPMAQELRLELPNGTRVRLVQPDRGAVQVLIAAAGALPAEVTPC